MFHPPSLVDTQKVIGATENLIRQLKQKGYKVYLVGNWSHIETLQKEYQSLLSLFSGIFVSGKLGYLKPYKEFYTTIMEQINFESSQILWLEKESHFITKAKSHGLQIIQFNHKDKKTIFNDLKQYGIML